MKDKITVIIAGTVGTMLIVTGFTLSASARNLPRLIDAQKSDHILVSPTGLNPSIFDLADNRKEKLHADPEGDMRNSFQRNLNAGQEHSVRYLIGDLNFDELQGGARSHIVPDRGGMRIDRQGQTTSGEQNIQVQVNGVTGRSTVATVLIPNRYLGNNLNQPNRREITRRVRDGLLRSFQNFRSNHPRIYQLTGSLSN